MAHIAFFTIPGAGHVNPTVGLVAELVARGHRVSYAVTAEHGGEVSRVGARLVPYRTAMGEFRATMTNLSDPDRFTADDFAQVLRALALETETVLPQLVDALAGDRPDLVVYDGLSGWSGRLLAACWGAPAVRCIPTFAANEHWSLGADGKYAAFEEHNAALAAAFEEVGAMFERIGSPIPASEFFGTSESGPALVFLPREFQYAGETFGSDFHFVGPCLDERGLDGSWVPDSGGRPLVLVSLGTIHNDRPEFFRDCVTAFADSPWHVVIATGDRVDPAGLGAVPSHIELRAHVPQQALLREAALFVSHAGMGSVMEALTHGVPIVAIPQMGEQRANADRVVELGLGTLLHRHRLNPDQLRSTVDATMHDPGIRARLAVMRERITATGGATAAADVIEHHLTHQDPR